MHAELARAYGTVKLACARTNRALGAGAARRAKADAIERACRELAEGLLDEHIVVDRLQGGAGTSTNMNVNEVLANRALELLGAAARRLRPRLAADDINLHQSHQRHLPHGAEARRDPAAARRSRSRWSLCRRPSRPRRSEFAHVVKVGRTQLQDAVLTTLGREMGAYAEALNRDRWRIYKCEERLRVVNLGGTAIGTGLAAPRQFIFRVVDTLRELTGIGFARAENLVEATQNADVFVEVSGILKAHAVSLLKICGDLRLLSFGPGGRASARSVCRARQAGSSHHARQGQPGHPRGGQPGGHAGDGPRRDHRHRRAASGSLELNPFLPLVAACLLESLDCWRAPTTSCAATASRHRGRRGALPRARASSTAAATALVPRSATSACEVAGRATSSGAEHPRRRASAQGCSTAEEFDELLTAEAVCRLGMPQARGRSVED